MNLYDKLFGSAQPGVWVLIDPDSLELTELVANAQAAEDGGATAILVGGSFISHDRFDETVRLIKEAVKLPVILFPGNSRQLSRHADGMLFTSLLSGRNPQYLIGEQVMAAPLVCRMGLATVPTAYLLVESGRMTSAQFISDTNPIPADKPALALAHAQAAKLLGMQAVYLEAGSGAEHPVPPAMIRLVSKGVDLPVIVGGGIRCVEDGAAAARAGASIVVVGTIVEKLGGGFVEELTQAIRSQR